MRTLFFRLLYIGDLRNFVFLKIFCLTVYFLFVAFSPALSFQQKLHNGTLSLENTENISQSIQLKGVTKVVGSGKRPSVITASANFPAFVVTGRTVVFENIHFDGLNFLKLDRSMDSLIFRNCSFTDSRKTGRAYVLDKTNDHLSVGYLEISRSSFENLTPVLLNQIYIKEVKITDNTLSNILRYGFRIKNDSHRNEGASVNKFYFANNKVKGLSPGAGKKGVARLIMLTADGKVSLVNNTIQDIKGVEAGGNILYWSGKAGLDFSNNHVQNISGNSYAIHDKGLQNSGTERVIRNNKFIQSTGSNVTALIHIYRSANYVIEKNEFHNLRGSAIAISNPRPEAGKDSPHRIRIAENLFKGIDAPQIISVLQTVAFLSVLNNKIENVKNTTKEKANGDWYPRFLSLYASEEISNIKQVLVQGNTVNNASPDFTLVWVNKVRKTKRETIVDVKIEKNSVQSGAALVRLRNYTTEGLSFSSNKLGTGVRDRVGSVQTGLLK